MPLLTRGLCSEVIYTITKMGPDHSGRYRQVVAIRRWSITQVGQLYLSYYFLPSMKAKKRTNYSILGKLFQKTSNGNPVKTHRGVSA